MRFRYWNNPEVLKKLGGAMGGAFQNEELGVDEAAGEGDEAAEDAEEEEPANVHSAASLGMLFEPRSAIRLHL